MTDQDQIKQLEASCAAMRELLITIRQQVFPGLDLPAKYTVWMHEALSTDAGKSLLDRLQAVEKQHTALRLASEELITYVRHGDQEDIGEAMAKIESILQPAQKEQK